MNHLIFAFYLFALLVGSVLTVNLFTQRRAMLAYRENVLIAFLITLFIMWGASSLYLAVNLDTDLNVVRIFSSGAFIFVGGFIYLLPKQGHALFQLRVPAKLFTVLAMSGPITAVLIWLLDEPLRSSVLVIPLLVLIGTVFYSQKIVRSHYAEVFTSEVAKRLTIALPLLFITAAATEGFWFGEAVAERGVTLALPFIYLVYTTVSWVYRDDLFPLSKSLSVESLPDTLTNKEKEVVLAVSKGLSNKQIADQMNVSPSTVKNHLYNIFKKLGVSNRVALLRRAVFPRS